MGDWAIKNGVLLSNINALLEDTGHSTKTVIYEPANGPSLDMEFALACGNKLLFLSFPTSGILLQQPERGNTKRIEFFQVGTLVKPESDFGFRV